MSIRFTQVSKSFGPKKILDQVSFEVSTGEILFIIGKSGMGKSVTLKQIIGIMKPDAGSIFVDGEDVTPLNSHEIIRIRKKCGMVFQQPALLDSLTVFENVAFGLRNAVTKPTHSTAELRKIVTEKLELVNLNAKILDRFPPEISYGTQKRVSLARTITPGPSYLLFDEPTTGLDPISTRTINDLILNLSRQLKVTSIVVSHDMSCALEIADKILLLDQGRVLSHGTVPEIRASTQPLIREFLAETIYNTEIQPAVQKDSLNVYLSKK